MNKIFFVLLLFCGCEELYKSEKSLQYSLDFFLKKKVDLLKSFWGKENSSYFAGKNTQYISYYIYADINNTLLDKSYLYQNGCIFTFKIDLYSYTILEYSYVGKKCYGLFAVNIKSNWK